MGTIIRAEHLPPPAAPDGPWPGWLRLWRRYGAPAGLTALALLASLPLWSFTEKALLFPFLTAVLAAAWYGGRRAGLAATLFSTLAIAFFELEPFYSPYLATPGDGLALGVFVVLALAISLFVGGHRHAEAARAASEAEFRAIFEMAAAGKSQADPLTCRYLRVNRRQCEITGYTAAELLERTFIDITHPDDRARDLEGVARALRGETDGWELEKRYVRKDGQVVWVMVTARLLRDARGRPRTTVATIFDVTDRKRIEQTLKEEDRRKDEFLATLAHELRNPLAPIRNALQILRVPAALAADLEWAHGVIERQVQQLTRLVDDLLDVSRISRDKIELRKERVTLAAVVERALETSRPLLEAARHQVQVSLPPAPLYLEADATRMAQVLANLLNNAAKYTREGGHIWLTASHRPPAALEEPTQRPPGVPHVEIRVRDDGIGIPAAMLSRIFEMFAQVDTSLERAQGGLGIGLTIVQRLVEMHGGTVQAHSDGEGRGSEFIVRLPVADPAPNGDGKPESGTAHKGLVARRVLVVDDNQDAARSLSILLKLTGHEVRVAYDGPQALHEAQVFIPDIVLLDIGLPGMNGYEVARRLRAVPQLQRMVLVAQTGWGQEEDRRRSREAGFDHHLVKPVDLDVLRTILAGKDHNRTT